MLHFLIILSLDEVKKFFEVIALASAAAFFIVKVVSGTYYVGLSLALDCSKRCALSAEEDNLVLSITITSGENAGLEIHSIQGKISCETEARKEFAFEGIGRLEIKTVRNNLTLTIPWKEEKNYKYRVSTKESTTFSHTYVVPKKLCKVEVVVIGSRKKGFIPWPTKSQWRVSGISIPAIHSSYGKIN